MVLALLACTARIEAADVWVTSKADSGPGTLRQAIVDASPADTIRFSPELSERTIILASQLIVDKDLTISGRDALDLQISGNDVTRILNIGNDGATCGLTVTVTDLRLVHARLLAGEGSGSTILTCASSLTVERVFFEDMFSWDGGGGLSQSNGTTTIRDSQFVRSTGAVATVVDAKAGTLTIERVTVRDCYGVSLVSLENTIAELDGVTMFNNSTIWGYALYVGAAATALVQNSTFAGNEMSGLGPNHATIAVGGTLSIRNSIVSNVTSNCHVTGTLIDLGNNLQNGDTSCGFGTTADPQFGTFGSLPVAPRADALHRVHEPRAKCRRQCDVHRARRTPPDAGTDARRSLRHRCVRVPTGRSPQR